MPDARNVSRHFNSIGETNPRHLPQSRIGLLGRRGEDPDADPALLGRGLERRTLRAALHLFPAEFHELMDRRHKKFPKALGRNPLDPPGTPRMLPQLFKPGKTARCYQRTPVLSRGYTTPLSALTESSSSPAAGGSTAAISSMISGSSSITGGSSGATVIF